MSDYNFGGEIALDPSDYVSGAEEAADASGLVADSADEMGDSLLAIDAKGVAAGGALAGLGTAAQSTLDDTRELRESLGRTAVDMGMTSSEANELARSLSDATFPIEDVTGTMDSLARQGVETEEEMRELATAADDIADATGTSAESVADNLGPAIVGLGDDLEDMPEIADAVTMAVRNTTLETEDLAQVMERSSEELNEMGLQTEDSVALIAAYAEETGKSGRTLRRDFNSAIREADGDMEQFAEITGVGEDELEAFSDELDQSEGVTQEYADAANESVSTMDRMRARFDDARLAAADMIGPVDAIAPAMQTASISMMALSTINFSAVIPSLVGVATAAAPIVVPLAAAAAAAGALYYAWDNNILGVRDITEDAFDSVMDAAGTLRDLFPSTAEEAVDLAYQAFTTFHPAGIVWDQRDEIMDAIGDVREQLPATLEEGTDLAMDVFTTWHPAGIVYDKREEIMDALPIPDGWRERGSELVSAFTDGIRDSIPDVRGAVSDVADAAGDYLPSSDAERGEFSRLTDAGAAVPETIASGMAANADVLPAAVDGITAGATPEVAPSEPTGESDTSESTPAIEDLEKAFRTALEEVLEGRKLRMEQSINEREFRGIVRDEIDAYIT